MPAKNSKDCLFRVVVEKSMVFHVKYWCMFKKNAHYWCVKSLGKKQIII